MKLVGEREEDAEDRMEVDDLLWRPLKGIAEGKIKTTAYFADFSTNVRPFFERVSAC